MFRKLSTFVQEVRSEMTRVTWPTRDELKDSTKVVIWVSFVFVVFTFIIDNIFKYLFDLIYGL
ncbi:MAG: preprotein translocase subunit SecE [bacterium]